MPNKAMVSDLPHSSCAISPTTLRLRWCLDQIILLVRNRTETSQRREGKVIPVRRWQSISLSRGKTDERPFALSTPQLLDNEHVHLPVAFDSQELGALFKMRAEPQPLGYAGELFGLKENGDELFSSFFTTEAPRPVEKYTGDSVRIRYFGHASLLIQTREISIMLDPLISYESNGGIHRYRYADLPETIDYVLITHNHQDHCMFETLLQLRHKIKNVIVPKSSGGNLADPSLKLILQNIGFRQVREIDEMESI